MNQFSTIAKFLHWLVASLIVTQYVLAKLAENAEHHEKVLEQLALLANHKSVGITILVLAVTRLAYRLYTPTPKMPPSMSGWQVRASKASHILLYGFLFALPLSGWLMSSAKAYSVSWFNLVTLPDFVVPNESLAEWLHGVHHFLAEALFVVAVIHILAALKHHYVDKDDVLTRMASKRYWVLFLVVMAVFISLLGRVFDSTPSPHESLASPDIKTQQAFGSEVIEPSEKQKSDLPLWNIDYQRSSIKFTADQAGAAFEGEWQKWSAEIQFDQEHLDESRFRVSIDLTSGFTNDQERDDTIRSSDFFDVKSFPQANFRADVFSSDEASHKSVGKLTMKGISADATLSFSVSENEGTKVLTGSAPLDRFEWNIGINDWADTTWVGQGVMVEVLVVANP